SPAQSRNGPSHRRTFSRRPIIYSASIQKRRSPTEPTGRFRSSRTHPSFLKRWDKPLAATRVPMKVLMPIGDATEVLDTLYPFFRLPEDGFEVVVAGPEARHYHGVMHEIPPNEAIAWDITREQPAYHIKTTIAFRDVRPHEYVGLFLSGG